MHYMLQFDRTKTSKYIVRKVKYLGHIVVHWKNPHKSNKGPTQCTKCAMYGHGSRNCFRKSVCIACGANHDVSTCQVIKEPNDNSPAYKCFNCIKNNLKNSNHRADDPKCPSRRDYLSMRFKTINNTQTLQQQPQRHFSYNPDLFPQMPKSRNSNLAPIDQNNQQMRYSEAANASNIYKNTTTELFSTDELFSIFTEATAKLRNCTTKMEQISVIMGLLKYAV